jgi:hypothetical protein
VCQALSDDPLAGVQLRENVLLHGRIVLAASFASLPRFVSQVTKPRVRRLHGRCHSSGGYRTRPAGRMTVYTHGAIRAGGHVLTYEEVSST